MTKKVEEGSSFGPGQQQEDMEQVIKQEPLGNQASQFVEEDINGMQLVSYPLPSNDNFITMGDIRKSCGLTEFFSLG